MVATDQDHAHGIARLLRQRLGTRVVVATSDDPAASEKILDFTSSTDPWLVAVRMVSEGVDIPRLRVGVFATTTTTELFFRQVVGRFVRWPPSTSPPTVGTASAGRSDRAGPTGTPTARRAAGPGPIPPGRSSSRC